MSKTPEQLVEEYCNTKQLSYVERLVITKGYIDGYEAAKDEYKVAIDTYNDVAKQMLEEAIRIMSPQDQLADADKVIDTCEHILDMEQMVDVTSSSGWISVKDRLPEDHSYYLVTSKKEASSTPYGWIAAGLFWDMEIAYFHERNQTWMTGIVALNCKEEDKVPFAVSYWMPLPKPPEDI